jgi:hypothetical protein
MGMSKKKYSITVDIWLFIIGIFICVAFLSFLSFLLVFPINNYLSAIGTVRFQGEQTLVSEVEGVVTEVYKQDQASVSRKDPILRIENEEKKNLAKSLDYKIDYLNTQLLQLQKLEETGALDGGPVHAKRLELQQAQQERQELDRVTVDATLSGYYYSLNPPKNLLGTYIHRGDVVGYLYRSSEKVVNVTLTNEWVDRFSEASVVRIYYKDPVSYFSRNLPAHVESIHANTEGNKFQIQCRIDAPTVVTRSFRPGTLVKVNFLVNSTSLFQEIFGFDVYGSIMARLTDRVSK